MARWWSTCAPARRRRWCNLHANGSGRITVSGLDGAPLEAHLNGSGAMELAGDVARLDAKLNGSGGINADVRQTLVAQTGGSGAIRVHGNPAQRTISGNAVRLVD
jgi:hypothetical protein